MIVKSDPPLVNISLDHYAPKDVPDTPVKPA
mgnify:CR=1 FL=1